jgi:macrolide-specific efflux system membrane fusion protein
MHLVRPTLLLAALLLTPTGLMAAEPVKSRLQEPLKEPGTSPTLVKVATPVSGIIVALNGENRLAVGDRVKTGQLLVQLDARLALNEVEAAKAKLEVAQAEFVVVQSMTQTAQSQLDRANQMLRRGAMSLEEVAAAQLARDRQYSREKAKAQAIQLAKLDLERAQLMVEMHRLHSPVNGVIRAVYRMRGEGVQAFDAVVLIEETSEK